jgi:hypothetical protein
MPKQPWLDLVHQKTSAVIGVLPRMTPNTARAIAAARDENDEICSLLTQLFEALPVHGNYGLASVGGPGRADAIHCAFADPSDALIFARAVNASTLEDAYGWENELGFVLCADARKRILQIILSRPLTPVHRKLGMKV